jgi:hypothetical protein
VKPSLFPALALALASVLALAGCATARTDTAAAAAQPPSTSTATATATATASPSPSPTSSTPPGDRDLKAALILKRAADTYRQAGKTDYFDAWWSYLTQGVIVSGLFVDTARKAYSDAGDLYGQDQTPTALDDWDELMDGKGQLVTHATLWHDRDNEAEYQATLITLDQADRLADQIAPGATYRPTPVPPLVPAP